MPSMCDSSQNSSPSVINKLRQFRFQKKSLSPQQVVASTSQNVSTPPKNKYLSSPSSSRESDVVPETPEWQRPNQNSSTTSRNNESIELKNGTNSCESPKSSKSDAVTVLTISSSSEEESSSIPACNKRPKQVISSDSDEDSKHAINTSINHTPKRRKYNDVLDELLTDKERCLKILMDTFPHADIMEMQDILVSCEWNIKKATALVQSRPINSVSDNFNVIDTLNNEKLETCSNNLSNTFNRCDSDSDDGWLSKSDSVGMKTYERKPLGKKKSSKMKLIISDDSDTEKTIKLSEMNCQNKTMDDMYQLKQLNENDIDMDQEKDSNEKILTNSKTNSHIKNQFRKVMLKVKKKKKLKKLRCGSDDDDDHYQEENVYDSDDSDNPDYTLTPARASVLCFFQESMVEELLTVPGCSKKKVDAIVNCRPFTSWSDLVIKFDTSKYLTTDLLNGARSLINAREVIIKLMQRCQRISDESEKVIEYLMEGNDQLEGYISKQPAILNERFSLAPYQLLGLNWLVLMHHKNINGILADEMGLGKTIQAISFIAHIKEQGGENPFLIVVPSSTLDNWLRELHLWLPSASVLCYHGPQDERRILRQQIANDDVDDFDVMVTTYSMVTSSSEDRSLFKHLDFEYVIFDEAHMLKNMRSQRYQSLMRIKAKRRLLLTGTPLQNNLTELMSLLIFVMPDLFVGKIEQVKQMFSAACKSEENRNIFERERIEHAKRIMKPFVLRRLKSEVLKQLPKKHDEIRLCPMADSQKEQYECLVGELCTRMKENVKLQSSGVSMMMELRKLANHPLLLRKQYSEEKLVEIAKLMLQEPTHRDANPDLILEDMTIMSDFEIHRLCKQYKSISEFQLQTDILVKSGKFQMLDSILPDLKEKNHRILVFSQFTMMLDILEEYMNIREYKFLRMDGSVPVSDRQELIDHYNEDGEIFVFLLSTRAGGLGINLTAANVVLIHDIDFNPYNDKQAEDRCHRVGQTKEVQVIRMISKKTIEEHILRCAQEKLKLERDVTANDGCDDNSAEDEGNEEESANVDKLLRSALGL